MKKLGCASCGGTKKMAKGGTTKNVNISKPGAGYAKRTVGGDNQKMNMYGIAQTGQGQMDGKTGVMKKGGAVKKPLMKAQIGGTKTPFQKGVANKDFKASDTSYVSKYNKNVYSGNQKVMADQAPKTTKGSKDYNKKLDSAYNKTYGSSNVASVALSKRDSEGKWPTKESEYRMKTNKSIKTKKK